MSGRCGAPGRSRAAEAAARLSSKAPQRELEAPKVSAVAGSLHQAPSQVLLARSEQAGCEIKTNKVLWHSQTAGVICVAKMTSATQCLCPENHHPDKSPVLSCP